MFEEPILPQLKPWESKKSPAFKKWLIEQTEKSPESWSSDFLTYIDKKYQVDGGEDEPSLEQVQETDFQRTLEMLALTNEDIRNKRVFDVGCHDGGFVITSLKKELTQEVFGLDINLEGEAQNINYQNHFYTGDFTEKLPIDNMDHVLSVGAITLMLNEEERAKFKQAIRSAIGAMKQSGDVRVGPIYHVLKGEYLDGVVDSERVLGEVLKELEEEEEIVWKLEPTDISVTGNSKDVLLMRTLIIRKM